MACHVPWKSLLINHGKCLQTEVLSMTCAHIMQQLLMQVFLTPEYLAISMEYAKGGDMFQYVKAKGGLQVG